MAFEVKKLNKSYGLKDARRRVIRNFSMKVEDGEMVAVVGRKGSGKSTLMNILTGLARPDSGTVIIDGHRINYFNPFQRAIIRSKRIGLVTRDALLVPDLTVYENLLLPMGHKFMMGKRKMRRAKDALRAVGLKSLGKYFPADLDDLETQKVCLARALMTHPKYLLLDEPTGNLQSADVDRYMDLVEILKNSGFTIIVLTHSRRVANHCDRLIPIAMTAQEEAQAAEEEPVDEASDETQDIPQSIARKAAPAAKPAVTAAPAEEESAEEPAPAPEKEAPAKKTSKKSATKKTGSSKQAAPKARKEVAKVDNDAEEAKRYEEDSAGEEEEYE